MKAELISSASANFDEDNDSSSACCTSCFPFATPQEKVGPAPPLPQSSAQPDLENLLTIESPVDESEALPSQDNFSMRILLLLYTLQGYNVHVLSSFFYITLLYTIIACSIVLSAPHQKSVAKASPWASPGVSRCC